VLEYSRDAQCLALASSRLRDQLRIVHTASGSVFENWPTSSTPLRYVSSLSFSPNGGYLAVGNDRGRVLLYRLRHYALA
jgi:U3 small nucleolar RNA-associated protein 18